MRKSYIKSLLMDIKKSILINNFTLAKRDKNIFFLREYGLTIGDVKETILDLTPENCIAGPSPDRDGYQGQVLIFKSAYIDDLVIYVKIRSNLPYEIVCISFHEDEQY